MECDYVHIPSHCKFGWGCVWPVASDLDNLLHKLTTIQLRKVEQVSVKNETMGQEELYALAAHNFSHLEVKYALLWLPSFCRSPLQHSCIDSAPSGSYLGLLARELIFQCNPACLMRSHSIFALEGCRRREGWGKILPHKVDEPIVYSTSNQ